MKKRIGTTFCKRLIVLLVVIALGGMVFSVNAEPSSVSAAKMNKKLSKAVCGKWWTQSGSSGFDVRFSQKEVKYYKRDSKKVVNKCKIKKVKKVKQGYLIIINGTYGVYSYLYDKNETGGLNYYTAVNQKELDKSVGYSGSSSLSKGRW